MTGCDEASRTRAAGEAAWMEMARRSVPPLPQNYAAWFARCLSGAVVPAIPSPAAPAAAGVEAGEDAGDRAAALEEATGEVLEAAGAIRADLADGSHGMGLYAETLATWGAAIRADESAQSLLRAVETLSAATAAAMERNRRLEDKLAASAARVARLQTRLGEMRNEARADALTGLVNRRGFDAVLKRAVAAARGNGVAVSLLMLDIDHFKRFNDTYGHPAGDLVLRLVGKVLTQNVKGRDVAARYGGEEFGVILIGARRPEAETVAEQIRAAIAAQRMTVRRVGPDLGTISVSIGVASCRPDDTPATLLERADRALYRAKHLGRDRVCAEEHAELAWAS